MEESVELNNELTLYYKELQDRQCLLKMAYQKALANKLELETNLLEVYKV